MATNFTIAGAGGRMGRAIASIIAAQPDKYSLSGAFEYPGHPARGASLKEFLGHPNLSGVLLDSPQEALAEGQVLLDFTSPDAAMRHAAIAAQMGKAVMIGATGFNNQQKQQLLEMARSTPLILASNTSVAMNLMFYLSERIAAALGPDYALELIEAHHEQKVDAPSGTAWTLLEAMAKARNLELPAAARHGRVGMTGPRRQDEIGVSVIRGGDIVGEHTVMFIGQGERLELTHRVQSRSTFAQGAIRAGVWLADKKPGMYNMGDVLGM
jgi:4-hydroxy-tetrahydrodipicolinate reductase